MTYPESFEYAFGCIIGHEGGYTNRRSDPGNWTGGKVGSGQLKGTKFGIAAHSYPDLDIKNLTLADAKDIYWRHYWTASGANTCPEGLDYAVFDAGVNTGNARARRWLQMAAGAVVDGEIGPKTRARVTARDPKTMLQEFQAQRTWHHMLLDKMDDEYGLGWSRRIIDVTIHATLLIDDAQSKKLKGVA